MIETTKYNFFYFDLEETIINEYIEDERFINIKQILRFIGENNIDSIGIFSFVMQNSVLINHFTDDLQYNTSLKQKIEDVFGIRIHQNVILSDLIKVSSKLRRLDTISYRDYFQHYSKQQAFIDFVRGKIKYSKEKDSTYTLLDDMVENVILYYPDSNVYIKLINVNTI
jgi:hypothetical protein